MYPSELYHALKIARKEGYGGNTPDIPGIKSWIH